MPESKSLPFWKWIISQQQLLQVRQKLIRDIDELEQNPRQKITGEESRYLGILHTKFAELNSMLNDIAQMPHTRPRPILDRLIITLYCWSQNIPRGMAETFTDKDA